MMSIRTHKPQTKQWQWSHHSFKAMNTQVQTKLYRLGSSVAILQDVEQLFVSFEKCLSRFNLHSELSQLNNHPEETFKASPTLVNAIEVALLIADITEGLYDPTILPNLEAAGYDRSFETLSAPAPLIDNLSSVSQPRYSWEQRASFTFRSVHLNRSRREINKPVGMRLDLGGMGKGWTVDRATDRLQGLGPFLLNAGGDIFAYHSPPGEKGWEINLVHPFKPGQMLARLYLNHQALATSTLAKRRWQYQGQIKHHLIDPRTGQPAETDALSVTVVTNRTVMAEVYAKVALILGVEQGLTYLQQLPDVEGLIYTTDSDMVCTSGFEKLLDRVDTEGFTA